MRFKSHQKMALIYLKIMARRNFDRKLHYIKCPTHPQTLMKMVCIKELCSKNGLTCELCIKDFHKNHSVRRLKDFLAEFNRAQQVLQAQILYTRTITENLEQELYRQLITPMMISQNRSFRGENSNNQGFINYVANPYRNKSLATQNQFQSQVRSINLIAENYTTAQFIKSESCQVSYNSHLCIEQLLKNIRQMVLSFLLFRKMRLAIRQKTVQYTVELLCFIDEDLKKSKFSLAKHLQMLKQFKRQVCQQIFQSDDENQYLPYWSYTLCHSGIDVDQWAVTRNSDAPRKLAGVYLDQELTNRENEIFQINIKIRKLTGYIFIGVGCSKAAISSNFYLHWPPGFGEYWIFGCDGKGIDWSKVEPYHLFFDEDIMFKEGDIIQMVYWLNDKGPSLHFLIFSYLQNSQGRWMNFQLLQSNKAMRFCAFLLNPGDSIQILHAGRKAYCQETQTYGDGIKIEQHNWCESIYREEESQEQIEGDEQNKQNNETINAKINTQMPENHQQDMKKSSLSILS